MGLGPRVTLSRLEPVQPARSAPFPSALTEALGRGALAGREREVAELRSLLGTGGFVLVSGEAGVGKTRLVAEVARAASSDGHAVLYGRCEPQALAPYEPFVGALRAAWPADTAAALPREISAYVGQLLPGGAAGQQATPHGAAEAELEQLRLFDAVVFALDAARGGRPGLLVLEDLHWAEASTVNLLGHLLGDGAAHGLTVLGTVREPDPEGELRFAPALARIERRLPVRRLRLGGLDGRGVGALVSAWSGRDAPPLLAESLREHTGGNPLLLRSTLAHLEAAGVVERGSELPARLPEDARERVPADVVDLVRSRLEPLGDPARALLTVAALIGADFSLEEARAAGGLELAAAVEAAERAEAAGLVRELDAARSTFTFEHALIRRAIAETIGGTRRAMIHLRIAEVIESSPTRERRHAELAQHYGQALAFGGAQRALEHALAAADEAERQLAAEDVASNLDLALRALDALGERGWHERYELLMRLGRARYRCFGPDSALRVFCEAADLAEAGGANEELALAGLGVGLERYLRYVGVDQLALQLLDRASAALHSSPPSMLRVRVMSARALERCFLDPLDVRERDMQAAAELADELGDPEAALVTRTARQTVLWHPRHTEDLLADVPDLVALAERHGRLDLAMHVHCTAFGYALELGRRDEMDARLRAAEEVADKLRAPVQKLRTLALGIVGSIVSGELAAARADIERSWLTFDEAHVELTRPVQMLWSFMLARESGELSPLREPFEAAVAGTTVPSVARAVVAEICARSGDLTTAREHLDVLAANDFGDLHEDFLWLSVLTLSATTAALLRDKKRASRLHELLAPYEGRNVVLGLAAADRPVAHALGLLARTLARPADAAAHFERAASDAGDFGAVPWRAEALLELGVTLRRASQASGAREPLREALDLADRYGGTVLAERARLELHAAGARPRRSRLSGSGALTPSERRVASLAADGMTNAEIARELVLARRTVETHLTHAYRKLGVTRREDLRQALT